MVAYSAVMLIGAFVGSRRLQLALIAILSVAYVVRLEDDIHVWNRASRAQDRALSRITATGARPQRSTRYYVSGIETEISRGIPVFSSFDLTGALQLRWRDATVSAVTLGPGSRIRCSDRRIAPVGDLAGADGDQTASYGRAVVLNASRRTAMSIGDRSQCEQAAASLHPAEGSPP
jgi:hypothetical protein